MSNKAEALAESMGLSLEDQFELFDAACKMNEWVGEIVAMVPQPPVVISEELIENLTGASAPVVALLFAIYEDVLNERNAEGV